MIEVKLTPAQMLIAAQVGVQRQVQNLARGNKDAHGASTEVGWQINIEGAMGEYALSKYLDKFWDGKGEWGLCDVGDFDVRTRSRHYYDLIVHDSDDGDRFIFLITGLNGSYRIHGGMYAREAKQQKYWKDPAGGRPAYFVPQSDLYFL